MPTFPLLVAQRVAMTTTHCATSDDKFVIMTIFNFQCHSRERVELTGLISIGFMMTSSNGNIFRVTGHLCRIYRSTVNSPHKGQWCGSLIFSLKYAWIDGWVNSREAGDLRRHHAHYDVTVMLKGMKPLLTIFSVSEILLRQKSLSLTTQQLLCYWNDFYLAIDLLLGILF